MVLIFSTQALACRLGLALVVAMGATDFQMMSAAWAAKSGRMKPMAPCPVKEPV
jgi:hypothetical protein